MNYLLLAMILISTNSFAAADVKSCFACHGENGNSLDTSIPKLNGQIPEFLSLQLKNFRSGERPNPAMMEVAKNLSDKDIKELADYFYKQKTMSGVVVKKSAKLKHGEDLYKKGKPGAPACMYCHGEEAQGVLPVFPKLAGQHADFIFDSIQPYKLNPKFKNSYAMVMKAVVQELSNDDIKDVSLYLSSLKSH